MPSLPRCPPAKHRWHIADCLALGLCGPDHYYPVLLTRRCGACDLTEIWAGEQNTHRQHIRLAPPDEAPERAIAEEKALKRPRRSQRKH